MRVIRVFDWQEAYLTFLTVLVACVWIAGEFVNFEGDGW